MSVMCLLFCGMHRHGRHLCRFVFAMVMYGVLIVPSCVRAGLFAVRTPNRDFRDRLYRQVRK